MTSDEPKSTSRREAVLDKVVKMLRLARRAGTEAEAHTALTLAQKLMYAHDIAEHELDDADAASAGGAASEPNNFLQN